MSRKARALNSMVSQLTSANRAARQQVRQPSVCVPLRPAKRLAYLCRLRLKMYGLADWVPENGGARADQGLGRKETMQQAGHHACILMASCMCSSLANGLPSAHVLLASLCDVAALLLLESVYTQQVGGLGSWTEAQAADAETASRLMYYQQVTFEVSVHDKAMRGAAAGPYPRRPSSRCRSSAWSTSCRHMMSAP